MKFPQQEHWSRFSFPPLGDLPDPGIEPELPVLAGGFFTTESPGKPFLATKIILICYLQQQGTNTVTESLWGCL